MYRIFVDGAEKRPTYVFNNMQKNPEIGDIFKVEHDVFEVYDVHHHFENGVLNFDAHLRPIEDDE